MPLIQRLVHPPPHPEDAIYKRKAEQVLDAQVSAKVVGLLSQINDLSAFACNISENLFAEAKASSKNISELSGRVQKIQSKLSVWENEFKSKTLESGGSLPSGKGWHRKDVFTQNLFDPLRTPAPLVILRNGAQPPPNLGLLDPYNKDKKCLAMYSNPAFFLDQWIEGEMAKFNALQEAKKEKAKGKKRARKARRKARAQVAAVNIKVFSAQGSEFQDGVMVKAVAVGGPGPTGEEDKDDEEDPEDTMDTQPKSHSRTASSVAPLVRKPSAAVIQRTGPPNPFAGGGPPPPVSSPPNPFHGSPPPPGGAPPPPGVPPPSGPPPSGPASYQPRPYFLEEEAPSAPSAPSTRSSAPSYSATSYFAPSAPSAPLYTPFFPEAPEAPQAPDAPPAPDGAFFEPPSAPVYSGYVAPPERPVVKAPITPGPRRDNLLDSIVAGAKLKNASQRVLAPPPAKPLDGRNDMLSQIRNRNFELKKHEVKEEEKKPSGGVLDGMKGNVMEILARRAAIEQEDSDSDWEAD